MSDTIAAIATGAQVAANFFASAEYLSKNRSNKDFVEDLYNTMLDRGSDPEGLKTWTSQLVLGKSRCWVFKQFCDSPEFKGICDSYGIVSGTITENQYNMGGAVAAGTGTAAKPAVPAVEKASAEAFVKHLYKAVHGREADAAGLKSWTEQMVAGTKAVEIAAHFFSSPEFQARKVSDTEFLKTVYRALLGREIDASGLLPSLEIDGMGLLNIYIRSRLLHRGKLIFRLENQQPRGACVTIGEYYG